MKREILIKSFNDLDITELYSILSLRNAVFIVEQNCAYQDIDNKDQESYHLMCYVNGQLAGYARLLPAGLSYHEISIGRVITAPAFRGMGLGKEIIEKSVAFCRAEFGEHDIRIGAQVYLQKFYNSLGFTEDGEEYDEDGILHIEMVKRADF